MAGVATMPLLLPLMLPVLLSLPALYPWAHPGSGLPNAWYLNVPFFALRGTACLVAWLGLAWLALAGRAERIAAPGLLLLAFTVTFAAIDLTMSLQPRFVSSIYGMMAGAGAAVLAMAAAILLGTAPRAGVALEGTAPDVRNDVAKLLFAVVLLSAYLNFMQLVIVWQKTWWSRCPGTSCACRAFGAGR